MSKKGSILIISLWILAILAVFALGLGHRAAINLRLAKYQRDNLRAYYLAKAGINRAIAELLKDSNKYDAPNEAWADNPGAFEKISFGEDENEFVAVSHTVRGDNREEVRFGVTDEESKINLKSAGAKLILALLEAQDVEGAAELSAAIADWVNPNSTGAIAKKSPLKVEAELIPALENFYAQNYPQDFREKAQEAFSAIAGLITVYTAGAKVNINTVSADALSILARSKADDPNRSDIVARQIIEFRDERLRKNQPFEVSAEINIDYTGINQSEQENVRLFNDLKDSCIFKSDLFKISSYGKVGKISRKVTAIYDRSKKQIVYWHQ